MCMLVRLTGPVSRFGALSYMCTEPSATGLHRRPHPEEPALPAFPSRTPASSQAARSEPNKTLIA